MPIKKYRVDTDKGSYMVEVEEPGPTADAQGYVPFNQLPEYGTQTPGTVGPDKPTFGMWLDQQAGKLVQNQMLQRAARPETTGDVLSLLLPSGAVPVRYADKAVEVAAGAKQAIVKSLGDLLKAARGRLGQVADVTNPDVMGAVLGSRGYHGARLAQQLRGAMAPAEGAVARPPLAAAPAPPPTLDVPAARPTRPAPPAPVAATPVARPTPAPGPPPVTQLSPQQLEAARVARARADAEMLAQLQARWRQEAAPVAATGPVAPPPPVAPAPAVAVPAPPPVRPRARATTAPRRAPTARPRSADPAPATSLAELQLTPAELAQGVKWHEAGVPPQVILHRILQSRQLTGATGAATPDAVREAVDIRNTTGRWPGEK